MGKRPAGRTTACARKKPAAKKKPTTAARVRIDGRRLSRRVDFTPRMTEHIRHRYEEIGDSPEVISRTVGVAKATIQRLVREQQWTRAEQGPRDLSHAEQLAAQARALAKGPPAPPFAAQAEGGEAPVDAAPVDIEREIERLLRLVSEEIGVYENLRAALKNEAQPQREALKTAHNLASLTSTLDELRRMRAANREPLHHADDDFPADIDAFRAELARRIRAFVASRRGPDGSAGDASA